MFMVLNLSFHVESFFIPKDFNINGAPAGADHHTLEKMVTNRVDFSWLDGDATSFLPYVRCPCSGLRGESVFFFLPL